MSYKPLPSHFHSTPTFSGKIKGIDCGRLLRKKGRNRKIIRHSAIRADNQLIHASLVWLQMSNLSIRLIWAAFHFLLCFFIQAAVFSRLKMLPGHSRRVFVFRDFAGIWASDSKLFSWACSSAFITVEANFWGQKEEDFCISIRKKTRLTLYNKVENLHVLRSGP